MSLKTDIINPPPSAPAPVVATPAATPAPAPATSAPVATSAPTPVAATPAPVVSAPVAAAPSQAQASAAAQMGTSGTQFKMNKVGTDKYTFEVVGSNKGDRFLDGVKKDGADVGLGTQGGNGTVWKVHDEKGGKVRLECVSCSGNDKYLDGSRSAGADQLGLAIKSNSGTLWKMNKSSNGTVTFECAEKNAGPKLLSLKGDSATPAPSAPSITASSSTSSKDNSKSGSAATSTPSASSQKASSKTDSTDKTKSSKADDSSSGVLMGSTGSQFILHEKGGDLFTIEVVGVNKSAKYVDGSKSDGTVGLGIAGNKGTTWKKETDKSGNVRFKCTDCKGDSVYLDGQKSDGAAMVGLGIKGNTGTEWKIIAQPDGKIALESVDKKSGPKLLSFLSDGKTVAPTVPYEPKQETTNITASSQQKASDAKKVASAPNSTEKKNDSDSKLSDTLKMLTAPKGASDTIKVVSSPKGSDAKTPVSRPQAADTKDGTGPNEALMAFWGGVGSTFAAVSKLPGMEKIEDIGKAFDLGIKIPSVVDFLKSAFEAKNAPNEGEQTLKAGNSLLSFLKIIGGGDGIAGGSGAIDNLQKQMNKTLTPEFVKVQDLKKQIIAGDLSKLDEYEQAQRKYSEQQSQAHLQGN